ncbi:MAG: response regulator [Dehalococcoidales bacterium]|nr:response regulator [Dehalococcoidales bacterium]
MTDKKILVVDDEPNVVRTLTFVLKKEGYDVATAENGEEALARVHESKPCLMFLDVMMPKKNGYEVCQELKSDAALSDIHIVMLSAKGQEADREKALSMGANEFITKPFSPVGVVGRVKELLA